MLITAIVLITAIGEPVKCSKDYPSTEVEQTVNHVQCRQQHLLSSNLALQLKSRWTALHWKCAQSGMSPRSSLAALS